MLIVVHLRCQRLRQVLYNLFLNTISVVRCSKRESNGMLSVVRIISRSVAETREIPQCYMSVYGCSRQMAPHCAT